MKDKLKETGVLRALLHQNVKHTVIESIAAGVKLVLYVRVSKEGCRVHHLPVEIKHIDRETFWLHEVREFTNAKEEVFIHLYASWSY